MCRVGFAPPLLPHRSANPPPPTGLPTAPPQDLTPLQHALLHPMVRHGRPSTPRRRPNTRVSSPASPALTTPPLSPTSSVSSQSSAEEFFGILASGRRDLYSRAREIGAELFSTPPASPTKARSVSVRMLACEEGDESRSTEDNGLVPMRLSQGFTSFGIEEVPRTEPTPSGARHPSIPAAQAPIDPREEFFAILASGNRGRYNRAQELGNALFVPSRRAAQETRPVKVAMMAVDADEYEAAMDAEDGMYEPVQVEPEYKERIIQVAVEEVPGYATPTSDDSRLPPTDEHHGGPSTASSSVPSFFYPPAPPPTRVSDMISDCASVEDDDAYFTEDQPLYPSVEEYAAVVQRVIADSRSRFRPLDEQPELKTRGQGQDAHIELEAVGCAATGVSMVKRPHRLMNLVRPKNWSLPWRGSVKKGVESAKRWARVIGLRKPSLDDVAQ